MFQKHSWLWWGIIAAIAVMTIRSWNTGTPMGYQPYSGGYPGYPQ